MELIEITFANFSFFLLSRLLIHDLISINIKRQSLWFHFQLKQPNPVKGIITKVDIVAKKTIVSIDFSIMGITFYWLYFFYDS